MERDQEVPSSSSDHQFYMVCSIQYINKQRQFQLVLTAMNDKTNQKHMHETVDVEEPCMYQLKISNISKRRRALYM